MLYEPVTISHQQLLAVLAVLLPAPTKELIEFEAAKDRAANPYGESHKPKQHGYEQLVAYLRVRMARAIYDEVYMQYRQKVDTSE